MTTTAVRGARLFDGVSDSLSQRATVVFEGTTIVSVGEPPPPDATVVDLPGATLLPGLIDTHVHLAFDSSADVVAALAARDADATYAAMAVAARAAAWGGVTTVRDLGDRDYLALALRSAAATDRTLPTILAAGPPITTPGGHCHFLGGETEPSDIRAAVRERAERGTHVVKIMASGGNLTPGTVPDRPQFEVADLRAAVDEAHKHGLPVTAHTHGVQPVRNAVAAGVDTLEHGSFITADGVAPAPPDLLDTLAARRITVGVTLGIVPGPPPPPDLAARIPRLTANLRALIAAGVPVVAGTDAGIGPTKPPDVVRWAVAQLVQVGLAPMDALRANTSVAARVCGVERTKGRLAAGFDADLLAVGGDPTVDPSVLHDIRAVFVRGSRLRCGE